MPLTIDGDQAVNLTTNFDTYLGTATAEGVTSPTVVVVAPAVPEIGRVSAENQAKGREGTRGLFAAFLHAVANWVSTKVTIGGGGGAPAYANGFTAQTFGGTAYSAYYRRQWDGVIELGGSILAPGAAQNGVTVFTLPAGYRPPVDLWFVVPATNSYGRIKVNSNGTVVTDVVPAAGSFSLDGIRYSTLP